MKNVTIVMLFLALFVSGCGKIASKLAGDGKLNNVTVVEKGVSVRVRYQYDGVLRGFGTWTTGKTRQFDEFLKDRAIAINAMKKALRRDAACGVGKNIVILKGWAAFVADKNMYSFKVRCQ